MKTLCLFYFLASVQFLFAQKEIKVPIYKEVVEMGQKVTVPMEFGKFDLKSSTDIPTIDGSRVVKVEIICTDYPRGYDLTTLNANRIEEIKKAVKGLRENNMVTYQIIRQMDFETKEEASNLFHGVVITYLPEVTMSDNRRAIKTVKDMVASMVSGASKSKDEIIEIKEIPVKDKVVGESKSVVKTKLDRKKTSTIRKGHVSEILEEEVHTTYLKSGVSIGTTLSLEPGYEFMTPSAISVNFDSTLFKIFNRNSDWTKMAMVVDVTGSMYPYTAQLLAWTQLNAKNDKVQSFTFFNDGDNKRDNQKRIGSTGGIYTTSDPSYAVIEKTMFTAMGKGGGGDAPENNLEATLVALERTTDSSTVVMVADNFAPVKDYRLVKSIDVPIRIIVCGAFGPIHPDYLNLARATGGSVHTMENDLTELAELNEGETVKIGEINYIIQSGKFVRAMEL